tara:strand:+ start:1175 stop:1813 length:639 start_codon:yes stop_codon:yes gene_type:complete
MSEFIHLTTFNKEVETSLNCFSSAVFSGDGGGRISEQEPIIASNPPEYYTSREYLDIAKKDPDKHDGGPIVGRVDFLVFSSSDWSPSSVNAYNPYNTLNKFHKTITEYLVDKFGRASIVISGDFLYRPISSQRWHMNKTSYGQHAYLTYVKDGGKSYFRYYDHKTDKIITSYDKPGWQIRFFEAPAEEPFFWHSIYAEEPRISLGFRILYNL